MERQSASAYFAWDITWTLCNACNPTFYWPVRCTPWSCRVCPIPGAHSTEKVLFWNWLQKNFLKGVVFLFWRDIFYIELLYYVTNFELVWTWNKAAVIENAKSVDCTPPSTTPVVLNRRSADRCRSASTFLPVRQIYYNFISQLQNARCWRLVHWLKK